MVLGSLQAYHLDWGSLSEPRHLLRKTFPTYHLTTLHFYRFYRATGSFFSTSSSHRWHRCNLQGELPQVSLQHPSSAILLFTALLPSSSASNLQYLAFPFLFFIPFISHACFPCSPARELFRDTAHAQDSKLEPRVRHHFPSLAFLGQHDTTHRHHRDSVVILKRDQAGHRFSTVSCLSRLVVLQIRARV